MTLSYLILQMLTPHQSASVQSTYMLQSLHSHMVQGQAQTACGHNIWKTTSPSLQVMPALLSSLAFGTSQLSCKWSSTNWPHAFPLWRSTPWAMQKQQIPQTHCCRMHLLTSGRKSLLENFHPKALQAHPALPSRGGTPLGCEAAVHATRYCMDQPHSEKVILNTFVSGLNQAVRTKTTRSHMTLHGNFSGPVTDPVKSQKLNLTVVQSSQRGGTISMMKRAQGDCLVNLP